MSDQTHSALEDAIRAHLADESDDNEIATDWYLIAAAELVEGEQATNYWHVASASPLHTLHGLVSLAQRRLQDDE